MRPDARVQSAIEILDQWLEADTGLDRVLTQWARANRYAGSGDRAAIADLVYGAVRRLRSANWVAGAPDPVSGRSLLHGALLMDGHDVEALFTGTRHAPDLLTQAEIAHHRDLAEASHAVAYDYPDWLGPHLAGVRDEDLSALRDRAPLDLRVNTLKATTEQALASLENEDIKAITIQDVPNALRVTEGNRKVARSAAYDTGLVEIQDAGSQKLAILANAKPGELIIDLCAGGGGKTLALAAAADGKANIFAHDISEQRMSDLPARARRAGAAIQVVKPNMLEPLHGKADLVFVDAPCSGSGAWRRNPDAKWHLTEKRLAELTSIQQALIEQAAGLCNPTGRIVYGTCSLFRVENEERVTTFFDQNAGWQVTEQLQAYPSDGTDGFFGTVLTRSLDSA